MNKYIKLKSIVDEIPVMISSGITTEDERFQVWKAKAERCIIKIFGQNSIEHKAFIKTSFIPLVWTLDTSNVEFVDACQRGLRETREAFLEYLEELAEEDVPMNTKNNVSGNDYSKVFIVHGHDDSLKEKVARLVEGQGLQAVILSEQANGGKTIIEKFEKNSDVGGAICLFTADDMGRSKKEEELKQRTRQNVVFETGYFMGKLGRNHICIIADHDIEIPSDLSGVVYTNSSTWRIDLMNELKEMGYKVDLNRLHN